MPTDVRVAQSGESMFERNIAHIAKKHQEVKVVVDAEEREMADPGLGIPLIGFLAGLDDHWIELRTTEDEKQILVARAGVLMVVVTGRRIRDLEPEKSQRLRSQTQHFVEYCEGLLNRPRREDTA